MGIREGMDLAASDWNGPVRKPGRMESVLGALEVPVVAGEVYGPGGGQPDPGFEGLTGP